MLTEIGVVNALSARLLVEPGYGYYGARDGRAATIEQVQRAAAPLEALFEQIYQRAKGQQPCTDHRPTYRCAYKPSHLGGTL